MPDDITWIPAGHEYTNLERAYMDAVVGSQLPTGGFASGAALNYVAEKNGLSASYDPKVLYIITPDGVTPADL